MGARRRGMRAAKSAVVVGGAASLVLGLVGPLGGAHAAITVVPEQTWETGVVTKVDDGDTVFVDVRTAQQPGVIAPAVGTTFCDDRVDPTGAMPVDGQGPVLRNCRVRTIGVQTPEKSGTQGSELGQCGAQEARAALAAVLPVGTPVQLRAINVTSAEHQYQGGRIARSVYYEPNPGSGSWVDASRAVLSAGLGMWMPLNVGDDEKPEYSHNQEYRGLVDQAAAARVGLFSGKLCSPGGALAPQLRMYVVADPPGDDTGREYVVIHNDGSTPVDLSGWTLRDSSFTYARIPAATTVAANDFVRVYGGTGVAGTPTYHDQYFNASGSLFANYSTDAGYFYGDGVYLYSADQPTGRPAMEYGDLRSWYHYPCTGATCTDSYTGKLVFSTVMYDPPGSDTAAGEYVDIRNTTAAPLRLGGYQFRRQNTTLQFAPDAVLAAGATLRINVGVGVDTPTAIHMGRTASLLTNTGDLLFLEHVNSATIDCRAWGTMSCPANAPVSGPVGTPSPTPTAAPAPSATVVSYPAPKAVPAKPSAPLGVSVTAKSRRLTVRWSAPATAGSTVVTKYRARAYLKSGGKLKWRATCYAKAGKLTCRTKKLKRAKTYYVRVAARNSKGYGATSSLVAVRNR